MAQYQVEDYIKLTQRELEQRFNNLKLLVIPFKGARDELLDIIEDIKIAHDRVKYWENKLQEIREDMENIVEAMRRKGL